MLSQFPPIQSEDNALPPIAPQKPSTPFIFNSKGKDGSKHHAD
jgi:hypothetical protein